MSIKKIVLIPAYEPTMGMIKLLQNLSQEGFDILVVDDGSGRNYRSIFQKAEEYTTVLNHPTNQGKGSALKTGFQYIEEHYQDALIVTMDCDGQHTVKDAIKLLDYVEKNPDTIAIGKRIRGNNTPLRSKLGNIVTSKIYKMLTGVCIYDTQTGLRAFHEKMLIYFLQVKGEKFDYEMNMLLSCSKNHLQVHEIEIETIYINQNSSSHFHAIKDSIIIYFSMIRAAWVSFMSFALDYLIYNLLYLVSHQLILSNTVARCISATLNYQIDKHVVFLYMPKKEDWTFFQYFFNIVRISIANTILLILFVKGFHINGFLAKILVELLLFLVITLMENKMILKRRRNPSMIE